jgi:sortase A
VGTVGKVLIATGLLMFAFVAYQLWGTGLRTAQAQNRLENEFEVLLESAPTTPPVTTTTPPPTTIPPVTVPPSTQPGDTVAPTTAPVTTVPPPTTLPPPTVSAPEVGEPLARLEIPSIGLDWIVIEGVTPNALQDGPGHFPETPLPGQVGNAAIAGHRTTHGQPFYRVDEVDIGDELVVTTLGGRFVYVMTEQLLVSPSDYAQVIPPTDPSKATLTLVSCHPRFSTRQRIIIRAELVPERSDPITAASPPTDEPSELPDEPVEGTPDTGPDGTDPSRTDPVSTDGPGTTDPAPVDSSPETGGGAVEPGDPGDPAVGDDGQELFENGWFSDPAAYPHVAAWGALLALIGIGAYLLSRAVRRNWVGLLVGIAPFVVVLYFWFENVNRLLPPNL